ncbi:uncharacterized protein BDR25DRAFT_342814 [Lindgomyces ingoldianus]|uniref:Uncharacterized protein n=1 Tax=Lindgomyces ingoldianus TaxID=673940 RepID=A0ACB6QX04_9PLEO|nr:uncharacterized protein BDR25DRAFT_342814 [Lindgomyces ingoldianus]KAF2471040.1 hypothetical protein BDR25DRAFT_342814 [Lindgomyces ingoldianus]
MVLDLLTLTAIPTTVGGAEAVHQQRLLDEDAESEDRKAPFHLHVYCDAQSKKRDEVHDSIVVLRDHKDPMTRLPETSDDGEAPHPFTGFYHPFPTSDLPHRPIPAPPILGLVSTVPPSSPNSSLSRPSPPYPTSNPTKPKLNWIYADKSTRELKYGPRAVAREHIIGPWDWTDDEEGLALDNEESLVVVEEEKGGKGWAVYWDRDDDRLKGIDVGKERRVLRCSLERRLVGEDEKINVE